MMRLCFLWALVFHQEVLADEVAVKRSFTNPMANETFYVISECADTPDRTLLDVLAPANTVLPMHHHDDYDEHIQVLEGMFYAEMDGLTNAYKPGDTVMFPKHTAHKWWTEDLPTKIRMHIAPCFDGFHESIEIFSFLPQESLNKDGIPKSLWVNAALFDIGGTVIHGDGWTEKILFWLIRTMAKTSKGRRTKESLRQQYLPHTVVGKGEGTMVSTEL